MTGVRATTALLSALNGRRQGSRVSPPAQMMPMPLATTETPTSANMAATIFRR